MMPLAVRATFGFENPNAAGALLAMMALACWLIPGNSRLPLILRLTASALCMALLSLTASRGALVALLAGGLAWWVAAGRPMPSSQWRAMLVLAPVIIAMLVLPGKLGHRLVGASTTEGSLTSRFAIYRAIPRLMVSAPKGWGSGQSALAYENWFQPEDDIRHYKNLLSTHGTWLVEWGWSLRFLYFGGWLAVLAFVWSLPTAFGIWVSWLVACSFSHLGKEWVLWMIPLIALCFAALKNPHGSKLFSLRAWMVIGGTAIALCLLTGALGSSNNPVRNKGGLVLVKSGGSMVFYRPDAAIFGEAWGKTIRTMGAATIAMDWEALKGSKARKVVLSGNPEIPVGATMETAAIIWINPPEELSATQRALILSAKKSVLLWGELRNDANQTPLRQWAQQSGVSWRDVPGTGLFVSPEALVATGEGTLKIDTSASEEVEGKKQKMHHE